MRGACRYEIFTLTEEPFAADHDGDGDGDGAVEEMLSAGATLTTFTRGEAPDRFAPPLYRVAVEAERMWRSPLAPPDTAVADLIARAQRGYVISADVDDAEDLTFLSACMNLTGIIAGAVDGVVVDRTTGIGYSAEQHDALIEQPYLRDMLTIDAVPTGDAFELRTAGMQKFAAHDFVIEAVAAADVELAKTILYDNVANYAAFKGRVEPGQTMQYQRSNKASTWFFAPRADGTLRIVDCDADVKQPLPSLEHCLAVFRPLFAKARAGQSG